MSSKKATHRDAVTVISSVFIIVQSNNTNREYYLVGYKSYFFRVFKDIYLLERTSCLFYKSLLTFLAFLNCKGLYWETSAQHFSMFWYYDIMFAQLGVIPKAENKFDEIVAVAECYLITGDSWNFMPPFLVSSSAKRITIQILVITKLNGRKYFFERLCLWYHPSLKGTTCLKLATETQE